MRLLAKLLLLACMCMAWLVSRPASALDPDRTIRQFKHTRWTADDGAPANISSMAQGSDGYLWLGAREGVFRFDGVTFEKIPPEMQIGARGAVTAMFAASDGAIWVGYGSNGVAVFRDRSLRDAGMPLVPNEVMEITETSEGAIWVALGRVDMPLARYAGGKWEEVGVNWGLPREAPVNILAARDGALWVSTLRSLCVLRAGSTKFEVVGKLPTGHAALSEDADGRIWVSDDVGTRAVSGVSPSGESMASYNYPTPRSPRKTRAIFDRDGSLWGTSSPTGMYRVRSPVASGEASGPAAASKVDVFAEVDGLTSNSATAVLEDREGNVWIATRLGLDRFRTAHVISEPTLTKPAKWGFMMLGASDGAVYVGQADSVYRILPGGDPKPILENVRETESICEARDGTIWIVLQDRIMRLRGDEIVSTPRPDEVHFEADDCAVDSHNALWMSAEGVGMFRRAEREWERLLIPVADEPHPATLLTMSDGSVAVYLNPFSVNRIDLKTSSALTPDVGEALTGLNTIYEGPSGLLLGGAFGVARVKDGKLDFVSSSRVSEVGNTVGLVQTPTGETWLIGRAGIVRLMTKELERAFSDPASEVSSTIFGIKDGLSGLYLGDGKRDVVRGGDGRLWFATTAGVVWVDPDNLSKNPIAPGVAIKGFTAGGAHYRDPTSVTLPAGTSSGEIDYSALSLSIPERVQLRYKLEGVDKDWVDPGARRQMFFTNLGPGTYRFHVIASNNDGVWNREGAALEFTIPPTFLQSAWFLLICALLLGIALWLVYSMRVRQVQAQMQAGLNVKLAERERIARELHDTLLQGFQGVVLRFQAVAERIPTDQALRPIINDALDRADAVLVEGRDRVRDLRIATTDANLSQVLLDAAGELAENHASRFDLTVEGKPRALNPQVREELQRIGEEAIRNAFLHARASLIEATIVYHAEQLRLTVRDNGVGMPEEVSTTGRKPGHFGMVGMRERAQGIGAVLTIVSRKDAGTEVLVSVPRRSAYAPRRVLGPALKAKG